jgi:hypothetical protein
MFPGCNIACDFAVNIVNALQRNTGHFNTEQDITVPGDGFTIDHRLHILSGKINNRYILNIGTRSLQLIMFDYRC